jgi:hypothetical protein
MSFSKSQLNRIGVACLFVNGLIFIFYALSVPALLRGVHWLITLAALLFIVALPAIHHSLRRVHRGAANVVAALLGVGMIIIVISDLLLEFSLVGRFAHDLTFAFANALFVVSLFAIGVLAWEGAFYQWVGILSIITGLLGALTYLPGAVLLLGPSLLLVGIWSFAVGLSLRKTK